MKILIEQSGYPLLNLGDLAMLQVAIRRLQSLWSDTSIQVVTSAPERLAEYFPNTIPLLPDGRNIWFSPLFHPAYSFTNATTTKLLSNLEDYLRRDYPRIVQSVLNVKFNLKKQPLELASRFETFLDAISGADLIISSGGGYLTDDFKVHAGNILSTIDIANRLGKTTAMFGQGLGPLKEQTLLSKARVVLPSVDLITLREKRSGVPILKNLDINPERFIVTGDDAIEIAYNGRNAELGRGIGINLRVAGYAQVDTPVIESVRLGLHRAAKSLSAPLVPVPISLKSGAAELSDSMTIAQLLKGYDDVTNDGRLIDTPDKIVQQVGTCRTVVTGSYHAAVFALSQGIPAIGLAKSEYYIDKFMGLADQFGTGCEVILLTDQHLEEKLLAAICRAWDSSEKLRPQLLAAAEQQIKLGTLAYRRLYDIVEK